MSRGYVAKGNTRGVTQEFRIAYLLKLKKLIVMTTLALYPKALRESDLTKCKILAHISTSPTNTVAAKKKTSSPLAPQLFLLTLVKPNATQPCSRERLHYQPYRAPSPARNAQKNLCLRRQMEEGLSILHYLILLF